MKYDLCIVLRVYPWIIDAQKVFCDDKFLLYKKSLNSMINAIGELKTFVYVLLDHCPNEYKDYTEKNLKNIDHDIIVYKEKQWNAQTFKKQIELLSKQNFSERCLFLEDDYLHIPWSIENFVKIMKDNDIEFWTTYNSPDYQKMLIHNYRPNLLYYNNNVYWNFASTTMTFFCTKQSLEKYKEELLSYTKWNHDFSMWFSMTKLWLFNIWNMLKALFTNFFQFKLFGYIRYKCIKYIIKTPKTTLYVPLLSGSAHIDKKWLPKWTDWQKIWNSINI